MKFWYLEMQKQKRNGNSGDEMACGVHSVDRPAAALSWQSEGVRAPLLQQSLSRSCDTQNRNLW